MLRKFLLGVALIALTLGSASFASAQYPRHPGQPYPQQPYPQQPIPQPQPAPHFHVMYRICEYERWELYRTYDCHKQSHDVARALQRRGYQAKVIHH